MVFTTKLHQEAATRWSRHSCQAMSKIIRLLRGILLRRRFRRCWEGPFLVCLGKEDTIKCFWGGMRSEILPNLTYQIQTRFLGRIYDKSTQPLVFLVLLSLNWNYPPGNPRDPLFSRHFLSWYFFRTSRENLGYVFSFPGGFFLLASA